MTYGHGHVVRYLNVTCLTQVAKGSLQLFRNSKCQEQLKLTVATLEECFPGASGSKESALQETWVQSPGEGNGNHSNILAWRITWTEESSGLQSMRLQSQILLSD